MRAARALGLAFVLLAAACGGGGDSATSAKHVTLVLDWVPNPDHVGIFAAMDKGFFARNGLTVTPRPPSGVSDALTLVGAGRADVGVSYEPELFFAQEHHAPVVAVATVVPTALASIIAPGSSGIRSPGTSAARRSASTAPRAPPPSSTACLRAPASEPATSTSST